MGAVCCGLKEEEKKGSALDSDGKYTVEETEPSSFKADLDAGTDLSSVKESNGQLHCSHGALRSDTARGLVRLSALNELTQALKITLTAGIPLHQTMLSFLEEPSIALLIDNDLVSITISLAVQKVKENDTAFAQLLAEVARTLETCLQVGVEDFRRVLKAAQTPNPITPAPQWFRKWNVEKLDVCSLRQVILYLEKRTPCNCLDEEISQAKQGPVTRFCHCCNKLETPHNEFPLCSRCRTVKYCSKECQKGDWKTHKLHCRTVSLA